MPDGIHHNNIWKVGWIVVAPAAVYTCTHISFDMGTALAIGYGMGRYINGDADQMGVTHAEGLMVNEIPILGPLVFGWMSVYGALTRRFHRDFFTHFPGVSTAFRLGWLFIWLPLIYIYWIQPQWWDILFISFIWFGLSVSDMSHYISDKFFSNSK